VFNLADLGVGVREQAPPQKRLAVKSMPGTKCRGWNAALGEEIAIEALKFVPATKMMRLNRGAGIADDE
jgi:hypothetical protein